MVVASIAKYILFTVGIIPTLMVVAVVLGNQELTEMLTDELLITSWVALFAAGLLDVLDKDGEV